MELKLEARKPRWWEKKWKPKKPILYIIEQVGGKWVNTYWWEGNWRSCRKIKFHNSGTAYVSPFLLSWTRNDIELLVVGRSGTTLTVTVKGMIDEEIRVKSLNPNTSEWTCFGKISGLRHFGAEVSPFDLEEKLKRAKGFSYN